MSIKTLQYWFSYGSTYTYLTVSRIEALTRSRGVELEWKPFNMKSITLELGMPKGPFGSNPAKFDYMWRDVERRAKGYGLTFKRPSIYPIDYQLTGRVGLHASHQGWCPKFTLRVAQMNYAEGRPICIEGNLEEVLRELDKDPEETIVKAESPEVIEQMRQRTDEAKSLGMFGSPSFVAAGELFWGDDRLEDAIEWCLTH